jgi:hypothetical protein
MIADLKVSEVRPFLPSKDFALSKNFYAALGWAVRWSDEQLAVMENGSSRLYLQNYYQKEWAENTMLQISVADARGCHEQVSELLASRTYGDARTAEPKDEPYGALVTYVWDPCGVLLHLAQWK